MPLVQRRVPTRAVAPEDRRSAACCEKRAAAFRAVPRRRARAHERGVAFSARVSRAVAADATVDVVAPTRLLVSDLDRMVVVRPRDARRCRLVVWKVAVVFETGARVCSYAVQVRAGPVGTNRIGKLLRDGPERAVRTRRDRATETLEHARDKKKQAVSRIRKVVGMLGGADTRLNASHWARSILMRGNGASANMASAPDKWSSSYPEKVGLGTWELVETAVSAPEPRIRQQHGVAEQRLRVVDVGGTRAVRTRTVGRARSEHAVTVPSAAVSGPDASRSVRAHADGFVPAGVCAVRRCVETVAVSEREQRPIRVVLTVGQPWCCDRPQVSTGHRVGSA
eukprot:912485-Rhodomonas_salina.2